MKFTTHFIEKVREANNIVELISTHSQLKRAGSTLKGLCPFPDHIERTPSFTVSEEKQLYHCFGCGRGGDIISFLQNCNGMAFAETIEYLCHRASIPLPMENQRFDGIKNAEDSNFLYRVNNDAARFYHLELLKMPRDHLVWKYLSQRGLSENTVREFLLGYASDQSWTALTAHLQTQSSRHLNGALRAGLIRKKTDNSGYFDLFRGRVMFPIRSVTGKVLGFGGRTLQDQLPKYLNSPESPVFIKSKVLYGLHESARYIRSYDQVILVEGYIDFLALYQAGIKQVVSVLGTALTADHARVLRRYTRNTIVFLDGDRAGLKAAEKSALTLLQEGLFPKYCGIPEQMDPDEWLKKRGPIEVQDNLKAAGDLYLSVLTHWLTEQSGSSSDKINLFEKVAPLLNCVRDQRLKDLYIDETTLRLGVSRAWLLKNLREINQTSKNKLPAPSRKLPDQDINKIEITELPPEKIKVGSYDKAEAHLLQLSLKRPEFLKSVLDSEILSNMSAGIKNVFELIQIHYRQSPEKFDKLASLIAGQLDEPSIVTQSLQETFWGATQDHDKKLFIDCKNWIHGRQLKKRLDLLAAELALQPSPEKLEQFMNIQRQCRSLKI